MSETLLDRLRALFRREKRELDDVLADATERGNEALDRRERELAATPEERLRLEAERAAAQDAEYEALRRKIEGDSAH
ncbi:MAG TPA: hypothetical protein VFU93_13910 [Acidimicrobiales bacterium]|nr:hypothetical protein [Acidimicrobiales bacterium]